MNDEEHRLRSKVAYGDERQAYPDRLIGTKRSILTEEQKTLLNHANMIIGNYRFNGDINAQNLADAITKLIKVLEKM